MSQVDIQFKANSTKTKLKQLLKNIDDGKPLFAYTFRQIWLCQGGSVFPAFESPRGNAIPRGQDSYSQNP